MVKQLKCQLVRWRNLFPETGLKGLQSDVLRMYISIGCTGSRYGWEKMRHWISLAPRQLWLESSQLVVPWWPDNVSEISETDQGGTDMNSSHHATAWGLDIREVSGVEMAYRRQFPFTIHKISEDIHVQTLEEKQIYDILCIVNIHEYSLFINIRYLWLEIFWVCSFCCFCCSGSRHHVRTLTAFGSRRDFVAARPLGVFQALGVAWPTQTKRIFDMDWAKNQHFTNMGWNGEQHIIIIQDVVNVCSWWPKLEDLASCSFLSRVFVLPLLPQKSTLSSLSSHSCGGDPDRPCFLIAGPISWLLRWRSIKSISGSCDVFSSAGWPSAEGHLCMIFQWFSMIFGCV